MMGFDVMFMKNVLFKYLFVVLFPFLLVVIASKYHGPGSIVVVLETSSSVN